jgi:spore coat polysaccharide biosynthesis protein SpsF (cytidylyltransferase family)
MIVGILQARMGSSRLPGKVLMEILGKPMLILQIERLQRTCMIDRLVVATTKNLLDDPIEDLCCSINIPCFRGSENDLLDRYYQAAKKYKAEYVVRLTGDDPLTDPVLIDRMIKKMRFEKCAAVTNSVIPTYPEGLDVTVLSFEALEGAWEEAKLQSQREHVTPYIFDTSNGFNIYHFQQESDQSKLRWTVDYEEDFLFVEKIYEGLYMQNMNFSTDDIYQFIRNNPSLISLNSQFVRNAGLIESRKHDRQVK